MSTKILPPSIHQNLIFIMTDKIDAKTPSQETARAAPEKTSPEKRADVLKRADVCVANVEDGKKKHQDEQGQFSNTMNQQKDRIVSSSQRVGQRELPPNLVGQIAENQKTINAGVVRLEQTAKALGEKDSFGSEVRNLLGQIGTERDETRIQTLCDQAYKLFAQEVARLDDALKGNKTTRGGIGTSTKTNGGIAKRILITAQEGRMSISENAGTFLRNVQILDRGYPDLVDRINAKESTFLTDNQVQLENFGNCLKNVVTSTHG